MKFLPPVTIFLCSFYCHIIPKHLGQECVCVPLNCAIQQQHRRGGGNKNTSAILWVSQVLDWIQIDTNFSEFADSITLRRIQENNSAGHGGEVWQITGDLSAPGSSRSADVDKAELMEGGGENKKKKPFGGEARSCTHACAWYILNFLCLFPCQHPLPPPTHCSCTKGRTSMNNSSVKSKNLWNKIICCPIVCLTERLFIRVVKQDSSVGNNQ